VRIESAADSFVLHVQDVDDALREKIANTISHAKDRREWQLHSHAAMRQRTEHRSPAERGEIFLVPQLCLQLDDEIVLLEKIIRQRLNQARQAMYKAALQQLLCAGAGQAPQGQVLGTQPGTATAAGVFATYVQ